MPQTQANSSPWRSVALLTLGAIALYVVMRLLPTGTNLEHADFSTGAGGIEMCDPANPQFIPVVAVKSPVSVELKPATGARAGDAVTVRLTLTTASGKRIEAKDLLVSHTEKLHLLIIDPSLRDYQHVHPVFDATDGSWVFSFTPKFGGLYRIFCDFVPAATSRGLYANADLNISGDVNVDTTWRPVSAANHGAVFSLTSQDGALIAPKQATLIFRIDGDVTLQPVMDAYAHLVAFDLKREGFAHLHPLETDLSKPPSPNHPQLTFKLTIPRPGNYIVWAQVRINGEDVYVPFDLTVM